MNDLINKTPELIREAAKSALGLLALVVLIIAILALAFFTTASESVKLIIFALIFVGAGLFVISVLRLAALERTQRTPLPLPSWQSNDSGSVDQVAALCYRPKDASIELLLVKTDGGRWIFPKGNVSTGEELWRAAQREAFEEAGASGEIGHEPLTTFLHLKQGLKQTGVELRIAAFPLRVKATQPPGEKGRKPKWFSPDEAEKAVSKNRQFKYAEELKRVVRLAVATLK